MNYKQKPEFSPGNGCIVDPEFIPASVRDELLLHLKPSKLTNDQKMELINFCNDEAQMLGEIPYSLALQRSQLEAIEANARRLLASMRAMGKPASDTLHAHAENLAFLQKPPIELTQDVKETLLKDGGNMLSSTWDWVLALEDTSKYAISDFSINKQSKPEQMLTRGYVTSVARHILDMTGKRPPVDRSAWFASFAECLGNHLGLSIGPRIVASGIEATHLKPTR